MILYMGSQGMGVVQPPLATPCNSSRSRPAAGGQHDGMRIKRATQFSEWIPRNGGSQGMGVVSNN